MGSAYPAEKIIVFLGVPLMKKLKKKFHFRINLKSKHLLAIMTIFCLCCIVATFASGVTSAPLQEAAGIIVVPFEKSINKIGSVITSVRDSFQDKQDLLLENEELKAEIDSLTSQNNRLIQDQSEYIRLKELYKLDENYSDYEKVGAHVIANNGSNWFSDFTIDKGSNDGIKVNCNVLAGSGLVGIVTEVGPDYARVRSIIDDASNVSAMVLSTSDTCMVCGDLKLMSDGKLRFEKLANNDNEIEVGEQIVTSHVSDRFVQGLFIGYISEIQVDSNNLTRSGYITPAVDFSKLQEVLVITTTKEDMTKGNSDS